MLGSTRMVAAVAMLAMGLGGTASADDPLDRVARMAADVADTDVPGGGGGVVPAPPRVTSAVVGYIQIIRGGSVAQPTTTWSASGALSDPSQWTCSGGGNTSYTVSCTPVVLPVDISYTCQVLHADVAATTIGSSGRTSMDCNSDGVPEAQTGQKFGPGGYDFVWASSTIPVTAFTCTLDLAVPNVRAGCGDPGLVGVE